jgi:NAD(P)-dependent dehydrogenase (short-subunit alcohol dehydrogenase family)
LIATIASLPLFFTQAVNMQLADRTFMISGGSSGLGLATAILLAQHGAYISVLDLNPPPPSTIPDSHYLFTKTDVSSTPSLTSALHATLDWIATKTHAPLSGAIACAGIGTAALSLPRQSESSSPTYYNMSSFDRTLAINLRGTVNLLTLALPHMAQNRPWGPDGERGICIVVSSVAAFEGQVGQLAYAASKGAVRSIVLPLARELGQKAGIRVLGIAPGVFETGMTMPKPKPTSDNQSSGTKSVAAAAAATPSQKEKKATGSRASVNPEMVNYPLRMGRGPEFARLVKDMIENPMLNGEVVRLDGGVRMPSRL